MAEIKSTLDLVMEKTKHLSLSPEEKEQQKRSEAGQRIKGLIQKYIDAVLDTEKFASEMQDMQKMYGSMVTDLLVNRLLDDLHIGRDHQQRLTLLDEICGINTTELKTIFDGYKNEIQSMTQERAQTLKDLLAQKRSISGSAVVPNVEMDRVWLTGVLEINEKFHQRLTQEKAKYN